MKEMIKLSNLKNEKLNIIKIDLQCVVVDSRKCESSASLFISLFEYDNSGIPRASWVIST